MRSKTERRHAGTHKQVPSTPQQTSCPLATPRRIELDEVHEVHVLPCMQPYRSIAENVLAVHAGAKSLLGATSEGGIPGGSIHSSPRQLAAHAVELFEV
ncbi:MAG: hypothetical protein ACK55Z_25050, partial [bacterium]